MSQSYLPLDALLRFAHVVEYGGFSGAARALGLPRQVVHRSIASLEAQYGVRLFERTTRSVRMTDAGRALEQRARSILAEVREAEGLLREVSHVPKGTLRLTAPHLFAETVLAPVLVEYLQRYPQVNLDIDLTVAARELVRDDYDVACRISPPPQGEVMAFELGRPVLRLIAAPSFLASTPIQTLSALERVAAVSYGASGSPTWSIELAGATTRLKPRPRLRVDSARLALTAVEAGLGVTVLPDFVCGPSLQEGRVLEVMPKAKVVSFSAWAVYASRPKNRPALAALLDLLRLRLAGAAA